MEKSRFDNLPVMTKEECLDILSYKIDQIQLSSDYYKAVFHLAKYPGNDTEEALINFLKVDSSEMPIQIAKRKSIEVLASFKCKRLIPYIYKYIKSDDPYLVENSILALQKLENRDPQIISYLSNLLMKPNKNKRIIIKYFAKLGIIEEIEQIKTLMNAKGIHSSIRGSCISAIARLEGDSEYLYELNEFIKIPSQRLFAIEDIIDSNQVSFLPSILTAPISPSFKIRAIKSLWPQTVEDVENMNLLNIIDEVILDRPCNIKTYGNLIKTNKLKDLFESLFSTDFSICYQALQKIISYKSNEIWPFLLQYLDAAKKDYGALHFFILLFSLKSKWPADALIQITYTLEFALGENWPDFMKFRPLAIIVLINLKPNYSDKYLSKWLDQKFTPYWLNRYAALMAIGKKFASDKKNKNKYIKVIQLVEEDDDLFVSLKAGKLKEFIDSY